MSDDHTHDHTHDESADLKRADRIVNRLREELQAANEARIAAQVDLDAANELIQKLAAANKILTDQLGLLDPTDVPEEEQTADVYEITQVT